MTSAEVRALVYIAGLLDDHSAATLEITHTFDGIGVEIQIPKMPGRTFRFAVEEVETT